MSRIVSMKLAAVHRPTIAPNHSKRAGARPCSTSVDRPGKDVARRPAATCARIVATVSCRVLGLAEEAGDGRGEDEERKQRQQRQIGKIAGVDEAVVVDADRDPLDDVQRLDFALGPLDRRLAEAAPSASPAACAVPRANRDGVPSSDGG